MEHLTSAPDADGVGTAITLTLDPTVATGPTAPCLDRLRTDLWQAAHLFPSLPFILNDDPIRFPEGIAGLARLELGHLPSGQRSGLEQVRLRGHLPGVNADVDLVAWVAGRERGDDDVVHMRSWVNGAPSPEHGDHIDGVVDALELLGVTPHVAFCHVLLRNPTFGSPVRDRLIHPELRAELAQRLVSELDR